VGADSIFLGAEGTSGLEHALIGSVSEEVLRHANRTVLVVDGHPESESAKCGSSWRSMSPSSRAFWTPKRCPWLISPSH
jgi:hypothetical protein